MSNLAIMRSFEIVVFAIFIVALAWILRQRKPLYLGALLAGSMCFVFDWAWCTRSFFNARFNDDLIAIPGLTTLGVPYPVSLIPSWGLAFGLLIVLLVMAAPWLDRKLGKLSYVAIWLIMGVGMTAFEELLVSGLEVYTYYQKPEFLIVGVPWSNIWLSGNLILLCYLFLRAMQGWAAMPERVDFDFGSELVWKGMVMGALPIWGAFVIAYILQLFWYGSVDPWIDSGRPF